MRAADIDRQDRRGFCALGHNPIQPRPRESAVLNIDVATHDLVAEAWLRRAQKRIAQAWLAEHGESE